MASISDEQIQVAQAKRGLADAWYLGSVLLQLGQDEEIELTTDDLVFR